MNRIILPGTIWIASDIHLGPQTFNTRRAFHAFLEQAGERADALILNGDLFDVWVGDDAALSAPPAWLAESLTALRQVASRIPLWIGHGNRDFLMGTALMRSLGTSLLPDPCCLSTDYGDVLLSHGDEYCADDAGYQRFRRWVRTPLVQGVFLSLSLTLRRKIANWARHRSTASNHYKTAHIMDVTAATVRRAFAGSAANTMVHGHTHRPAMHHIDVDGRACVRIVLPDWDYDDGSALPRGGWLALDARGPQLMDAVVLPKHQPGHDDQPERDAIPGKGPVGAARNKSQDGPYNDQRAEESP